MATPVVLYETEYEQLKRAITRLCADANAKFVFLVDRSGQQIASHGEMLNLDTTSLASLTAGNVAATDGLAHLIGERGFPVLSHEGERDNLHISIIAARVILVVIFDVRSSLGLVRLRVKRATAEMTSIFDLIDSKVERDRDLGMSLESPFAEITEEDIDALFN
jgi:predicted regulator of Ras-like GTPase activity (Roadblock/LC7/MglB family)